MSHDQSAMSTEAHAVFSRDSLIALQASINHFVVLFVRICKLFNRPSALRHIHSLQIDNQTENSTATHSKFRAILSRDIAIECVLMVCLPPNTRRAFARRSSADISSSELRNDQLTAVCWSFVEKKLNEIEPRIGTRIISCMTLSR
jgi:hypothetical protein